MKRLGRGGAQEKGIMYISEKSNCLGIKEHLREKGASGNKSVQDF